MRRSLPPVLSPFLVPVLLLVLSSSSPILAGDGAEIGIYLDSLGTQTIGHLTPFVPVDVYVVAFQDSDPGLEGFEFSIEVLRDFGDLILIGCEVYPPDGIYIGSCENVIAGTGQCILQSHFVLAHYQFLPLNTVPRPDQRICLGPSSPSSVGGAGPAYVDCAETLYGFGVASPCVTFDPSVFPGLPELLVGNGFAALGATAVVSVSVSQPIIIKGDPSRLAGIDLELSWDPALATLEDVILAESTQGWLVAFDAGSGTADISAAGTSVVAIPSASTTDVLHLQFRMGNVEGQTPIEVVSSRLFDIEQVAIEHLAYDGGLTPGCDKGDPVDDDEVNSADGIRTLLMAVGLFDPSPLQFCAADMNADGVIDVGDAVLVLQRAVGQLDSGSTVAEGPSLTMTSGPEPGEVLLQIGSAAGLDLLLAFDPESVIFRSVSVDEPGGLVVCNGEMSGTVRLGFASAQPYTGTVRLRFDVSRPAQTLDVRYAAAFDRSGTRQMIDLSDLDFRFGVTSLGDGPRPARALEFLGALPNPFNPSTELRFRLSADSEVTVRIFDVAGRHVRTIAVGELGPGEHGVGWDGTDELGRTVASGVYLVRMVSSRGADGGRVVLLK